MADSGLTIMSQNETMKNLEKTDNMKTMDSVAFNTINMNTQKEPELTPA